MRQGRLSDYFADAAAKVLSAVEVDPTVSNQHEFNGVSNLKPLLGEPEDRIRFETDFVFLDDAQVEPVRDSGLLTWYDARRNDPTRAAEWRLYYTKNACMDLATEGDSLVIAKKADGSILALIAANGSTIGNQLLWLFGIEEIGLPGFKYVPSEERAGADLSFAERIVLEAIGIEPELIDETHLEAMLSRFGEKFPTTRVFSAFAREVAGIIDVQTAPDSAIVTWMTQEEALFRTLERHIVAQRLASGFGNDVDGFISFSLSVQNTRKSRVGHAFEHHLAELFSRRGIRFSRNKITENKSRPDFIFPSVNDYHDPGFDVALLTVLGAKSTLKERWRQVLAEASRVQSKHLATLETAISTNQTDEMRAHNLRLVVPYDLHSTFTKEQQSWLFSVEDLIQMLNDRQNGEQATGS